MFAEQLLLTLPPLLPEQEPLQPPVPTVLGPVDYRTWRQRLERIDEILNRSRVEEVFVRLCVQRRLVRPEPLCDGDRLLLQRMAATALRASIARTLTSDSYREFSTRLADSPLLQWFCRLSRLGTVQIPGKSHLQRYQEIEKKGVNFERDCLIFEVCQPQQAKKVLEQNMSVSTALPCRISIYQEGGKTILATLKPTTLLSMFNTPQLEGVAQDVEDTNVKIMREAASG